MAKNQINIENSSIENFYNNINSNEEEPDNSVNMLQCQIGTVNITKNKKIPLENITLNWLKGSSCFKGRKNTLIKIKELSKTKKPVVIHGAPGIGKTETARHFAEKNSRYFNGNLIWVYAETQQNIQDCFEKLAKTLKLNTLDVSQVYSKFVNSSCLFIFDNVDNMAAICNYLPSNTVHPTVHILITSQLGEWDASVNKINIGALKPEDAVNILSEKLGDTYNKNPQIDWIQIVKQVECIPLAVQIVASLLYQKFRTTSIKNFDLDAFIKELMDGSFVNSKFLPSEQNLYNKTVISSICSALNRLQMEEALDLLSFIAYLDADYIYYDALILVSSIKKSRDKLQEALNKLKDYSLIQFDSEEDDYQITIHRTVQLVLRKYDIKELNGEMFKATFKTIFSHPGWFIFHEFTVLKYAEMEEFQNIKFYKENETVVDLSFLPLLAKVHFDKILEKVLPTFKNEFYETAKYNEILNEMLFQAICNRNKDMRTINLLLNYGAKIEYSPENNWTNGFHEASRWLSIELFDRLLESNDSENIINSKDDEGLTILHLLVKKIYKNNIVKIIECLDHLISKWKADISIPSNYLNNILHTACRNWKICLEIIKYLVEKCNCKHLLNSQNEDGCTPLHFIFRYIYSNIDLFKIASYFIEECEADITIQNKDGWNILFYACRYRTPKLIDFALRLINDREMIKNQDGEGDVAFTQLIYNNKIKEDQKIKLMELFIVNEMDFKIRNKRNNTLAEIAKEKKLLKLSKELRKQENGIPNNERKIKTKKLCILQ